MPLANLSNRSSLSEIIVTYGIIFGVELLLLYPGFAWLKWKLMTYIGIPRNERKIIFSNRCRYFDLNYFIKRYGDKRLRMIDGISRKCLHIVTGLWQLAILNIVVKNTEVALLATLIYQAFILVLSTISYRSNKVFGMAGLMYGASSRIRDGIYGRKNLFAARCSFLNLLPLALIDQVARNHVSDPTNLVLFSFFVFLPLTIGDALGEVVGTIWGKQKLQVWGIGEINRKSILGTNAVFFGSLIPLLLVVFFNHLTISWWCLAVAVAVLSTIVELAAPRGTDNFGSSGTGVEYPYI
ncbi:MAG: hypothetical protein AAFQ63_07020 [Cyanobacteria bacterium J06621_11]